ncbi:hypothetical protein EDC01DRAFT_775019 [Geopyxis carbonaria]|nr:hypothetical protein EDC01DRAFT_775019 [Geopyxis carbonaria]
MNSNPGKFFINLEAKSSISSTTALQRGSVSLRFSPSPARLRETLGIYDFLRTNYGELAAFKALRQPSSTATITPRGVALFSSTDSADRLRAVGKVTTPEGIVVTVDSKQWDHMRYLQRARSTWNDAQGGSRAKWAVRASGQGAGGWRKTSGESMWGYKDPAWSKSGDEATVGGEGEWRKESEEIQKKSVDTEEWWKEVLEDGEGMRKEMEETEGEGRTNWKYLGEEEEKER